MAELDPHTTGERGPISDAHPDRLATVGCLLGMGPTAVDACRVLELGCAEGGNLIPLALALPDAEFVGVDRSRRRVLAGRAVIAALGIGNVRLEELDASSDAADDANWGRFDYVLCHGLDADAPDEVRASLERLCKNHLAPNGIVYLGCRVERSLERLAQRARGLRLKILGDVGLANAVADGIDLPATLLCHEDVPVRETIEPRALDVLSLRLTSEMARRVAGSDPNSPESPVAAIELAEWSKPATQAALSALRDCYPRALAFDALVAAVAKQLGSDGAPPRHELAAHLLACVFAGFVELLTWQPELAPCLEPRPRASRLVAFQVALGGSHVTNQLHESVSLDPLMRALVALSDGTRNRGALVEHLVRRTRLARDASYLSDGSAPRSAPEALVEEALHRLFRAALLVP